MITFFLIIGGIGVVISALFLGTISGTPTYARRGNYSETKEHHDFRTTVGLYAGVVGLIGFGLAALLYYVF
ncbi:DUF5316 family protein [Paraliobacillus salinarum]|uniref:DUF5316 family protein n=1 Tax=Paraliobacillus salinarum TaxID=1158996 RepID=UPI0015F5A713|nr:DUF5316 family protein [Paraliobacillus salinarum]